MRAGETPVPIPNTMVKTCTADDTMLETAWESRWMPESLFKKEQVCKCRYVKSSICHPAAAPLMHRKRESLIKASF